jgi:hypothetical protein
MESETTPINELGVQAQLNGNSGRVFPTDLTTLYTGYIFHLTGANNNKVYLIQSCTDTANPYDECIEIRRGKYKWVELVFNEEKKQYFYGDEVQVQQDPVEYPSSVLHDITDVINKVYLKFDLDDKESSSFMKTATFIKDQQSLIECIEYYTSSKLSQSLTDTLLADDGKKKGLLLNAMKGIVYTNYMNKIMKQDN